MDPIAFAAQSIPEALSRAARLQVILLLCSGRGETLSDASIRAALAAEPAVNRPDARASLAAWLSFCAELEARDDLPPLRDLLDEQYG